MENFKNYAVTMIADCSEIKDNLLPAFHQQTPPVDPEDDDDEDDENNEEDEDQSPTKEDLENDDDLD